MLSDIDYLALAHPRQHLTRMVAQVSQTYRVRVRSHASNVSQNCEHKPDPDHWRGLAS
jgi:hypothetical protein